MHRNMTFSTGDVNGKTINILMVDDSKWDAELTHSYLQEIEGITLHFQHCLTLEQAERSLCRERPDLVLLDIQFQHELSGFDFLQKLRDQKVDIPVIVLTAFNRERIANRAFRLGAEEFLSKQDLSCTTLQYAIDNALTVYDGNERSRNDPLTGLPNQRYIRRHLKEQLNRPSEDFRYFSLFLIDIDQYRDLKHGSEEDEQEVFRQIGEILKTSTNPPEDIATRFGGDEFCVLMKVDDKREALEYVEFLLQKLTERFSGDHAKFDISCSIGIAFREKSDNCFQTPYMFIQSTEKALQKAKEVSGNSYFVEKKR